MVKKIAILSIDGGGIRGIIPAVFLMYIEQELQRLSTDPDARIVDYFDYFVGTSTGSLLVAALLSPNKEQRPLYEAKQLVPMYRQNCTSIFDSSLIANIASLSGTIDTKYSADSFKAVLKKCFGDVELRQLLKPCLIPSYEITQAKNYFFSQSKALGDAGTNFFIRDVCLAACAMPSYFPPASIVAFDNAAHCFLDGGIFATNPSLCAYAEARKLYPTFRSENMLVLSLSTGKQTARYDCEQTQHWGAKDWHYPITNIVSSTSSEVVDYVINKIFLEQTQQYLRINPNIDKAYYSNMDNCDKDYLDYLERFARVNIERYRAQLDRFIASLIKNRYQAERIPKSKISANVTQILQNSAQKYPDHTAFIGFGHRLNFSVLQQKSTQLANYLQTLTAVRTVAIILPNVLAFPISLFAVWRAAKVVVLINPLLPAQELEAQLINAQVDMVIGSAYFFEALKSVIDKTQIKYLIDSRLEDLLPKPKQFVLNLMLRRHFFAVEIDKKIVTTISFAKAIKLGTRQSLTPSGTNNIALLQYTGGTSGVLKAAILTHKNLLANLAQLDRWLPSDMVDKHILTALPLYHIFALTVNCLLPVKNAMTSVLVLNARDSKQLVEPFKKYPIHIVTGVNTLYNHLLNYSQIDTLDFSHLETCIAGGMALQQETAKRWQQATNCAIIQGYGLTETSPVISVQNYGSYEFNHSVGHPLLDTQVRIIPQQNKQDTNQDKATAEPYPIGEVVVKGEQVTQGYWQHPELNIEIFTEDGYFRTGDLGYLDDKGQLFLVDRIKEMIIVSGFNIYPSEVEKVLNEHDNILESACVGVADETHVQKVVVFVVKHNPDKPLSEQAVIDYASERLVYYKVPKIVNFTDNLPKNNVGKILKRELLSTINTQ